MPRVYVSVVRDLVHKLLSDGEPRTVTQIAEELCLKRYSVGSAILNARSRFGCGPTGFVIVNYYSRRGCGGREAPIYAPGFSGALDAPRPKYGLPALRAAKNRYAKKMRVVINGKTTKSRGRTQNPWLQILGMRQSNYKF